ncbi:MAG: PIN domain-containing protein [Acidobacteria bacterium]|jgi:predicted nucleic acid-binding protein|nr:PIN domain-containing protein [Acidobacteriota bacterium]
MMARPGIFDTSIYIRALRQGNNAILKKRQSKIFPLWLSAVVLEELYVGASDKRAVKVLTKFEREFTNINRLLVPNQTDWSIAGQILNKIGKKYGFEKVGKARLTNDTLLAASVARMGFTLLTANKKDFQLVAEFREFEWEVI